MLDDVKSATEAAEIETPPEPKEDKKEESKEEKKGDVETEGESEENEEEEKYSEKVQKRIGDLTKKRRDAERKAERLERELEIERGKKESQEHPKIDYDSEIDKLWEEHEKAMAELDGSKASKITKQIYKLEKERDKKLGLSADDIKKQIREDDEKKATADFYKRNKWIDKNHDDYDPKKRAYAIGVEARLIEEGFDGTYRELLKEVEKEVDDVFKTKKSSLPNVAGVGGIRSNKQSESIELDEAQKYIAYGLFPSMSKRDAEKEYSKICMQQKRRA